MSGAGISGRPSFVRLVRDQTWELIRRPRVRLLVLVLLAGFGWRLFGYRDGQGGQLAWWSLLRNITLYPLALAAPLLVAVVSGTALAADRRSGSVGQMLSRGVSRLRWALSHLVASALVASFAIGGTVAALAIFISLAGPASGTSELFSVASPGFPQGGTYLALLFAIFAAAACVFWACLFCFVGTLTTNLFAVVCVPVIANLVLLLAGGVLGRFDLERLATLDRLGPGPVPIAAFWVTGTLLAVVATLIITARRQALD